METNHRTMKTVKEWLEELPDGYMERALKNLDPDLYGTYAGSMTNAISWGFRWDKSPEGIEFWAAVYDYYSLIPLSLPFLPPLPTEK